jgi:hypothetical protein
LRPIAIRHVSTVFHRYKPEEMSEPLPQVLHKILPETYARCLVDRGEMMWSALTWFQNEEDVHRGDQFEGSHRFFPVTGLEVNRLQRDGRADNAKFTLPSHGLVSKAAQSNHIFVYSMTLDLALAIGDPTSRMCVEIFNPTTFTQRGRNGIKRRRNARPETLIHDRVRYWASENPPEEVWALPHLLTMHKHKDYESQCEYRLAFGTRSNVFDFENVQCYVVEKDFQWPRLALNPQSHRMKLRPGGLEGYCRLLGRG